MVINGLRFRTLQVKAFDVVEWNFQFQTFLHHFYNKWRKKQLIANIFRTTNYLVMNFGMQVAIIKSHHFANQSKGIGSQRVLEISFKKNANNLCNSNM